MIDGSVLQSAQRCFEKKSRVVVKMVVNLSIRLESNEIYAPLTLVKPVIFLLFTSVGPLDEIHNVSKTAMLLVNVDQKKVLSIISPTIDT